MRYFRVWMLAAIVAAFLSACAHITIKQVPPEYPTHWYQSDGIHFYRPKPYLMIAQTLIPRPGGGSPINACSADIKYYPDYSHEYVMIPHYWLGVVSMKPALADGWNLTNFDSTVDTKIPETITAVTNLAQSAAKFATFNAPINDFEKLSTALRPGLYPLAPSDSGTLAIQNAHPVFWAGNICESFVGVTPKSPEVQTPTKPPP